MGCSRLLVNKSHKLNHAKHLSPVQAGPNRFLDLSCLLERMVPNLVHYADAALGGLDSFECKTFRMLPSRRRGQLRR